MTWLEFTTAVNALLTTDGKRLGTESYMDLQTRAACVDIQQFISFYRGGHEEIYGVGDLIGIGSASSGQLPAGADIGDCYLYRYTATVPDHSITGQVNTAVSVADFFTADMVGKLLLFGGAGDDPDERRRITEVISAREATFDGPVMDELEVISLLTEFRVAFDDFDWQDRMSLLSGQACLDGKTPVLAVDEHGGFYAYPAIAGDDEIHLFWDGIKSDFEDSDTTPFDLQMAAAVADWVKAECFRHFDHERGMTVWQSFMAQPNGTYYRKKRALWREKRNLRRLKS